MGIIQSLNSDNIKEAVNNPDKLPTFRPTTTTNEPKTNTNKPTILFSCKFLNNIPHTVLSYSSFPDSSVPIIKWESTYNGISPEKRCIEVSLKFQEAYNNRVLENVIISKRNGKNVICASSVRGGECEIELFELKPSDNPKLVLSQLIASSLR
ncbi:MAG: COP23 domain-containing protein, partial [Xenococcus sp. (in: cyanobacteria)]